MKTASMPTLSNTPHPEPAHKGFLPHPFLQAQGEDQKIFVVLSILYNVSRFLGF